MSKGPIYGETDYDATITNRLEREIAFWMTPEQVANASYWLAHVLGVVELMLLFEYNDIGSSVYVNSVTAVQRWRETLLTIWDGDWQGEFYDNDFPYYLPEYRQQHRPGIIALFDCLESVARIWEYMTKTIERAI